MVNAQRRDFVRFAGSFLLSILGRVLGGASADAAAITPPRPGAAAPFSRPWLLQEAEALSQRTYEKPELTLPRELAAIDYDAYRDIRFRSNRMLWQDSPLQFWADFFHVGGLYSENAIQVFNVRDGYANEYDYNPTLFTFGPLAPKPPAGLTTGFSGIRLHTPLNNPLYFNEFAVFQGASYFRATGRGQTYGLSARALALNSGRSEGEEFPIFRSFWLEQPEPGDTSVVIHALLDSRTITGCYTFTFRPGDVTMTDVECTLFPRRAASRVGIAPLTSMFFLGGGERLRFDDFRPEVHDSEGLAIWTGDDRWLWRPLVNPRSLQFSVFADHNPRGFGLIQRTRSFSEYQDLEAHYERRPSAWVEPLDDWGEGVIELLELPTQDEYNDNIVAYWRPESGLAPGAPHQYRYRLHWCWEPPAPTPLQQVSAVHSGRSSNTGAWLFVVDFLGPQGSGATATAVRLEATTGKLANIRLVDNPITGGRRLSFDYYPDNGKTADISGELLAGGAPISESWIFRWTA